MKINFFEEFPNDENLNKLRLINFSSIIFVASKSLEEFKHISNKIKDINPRVKTAYWPILDKSYWISPFSYHKELINLYKEISNNKHELSILLDLELPILNKKLLLVNLFYFFRNKRIIHKILSNSDKFNLKVYAAEYPAISILMQKIFHLLGISYSLNKYNYTKIIMCYSSSLKYETITNKVRNWIIKNYSKYNDRYQIGIGTIEKGVVTKKILTPSELEKELLILEKKGVNEITIFRLGGLNIEYINVLSQFNL